MLSPDAALELLRQGNQRYVEGVSKRHDFKHEREALAGGRRLKLVARAEREGRRITARVALEDLAGDDLLAGLEGQQNALILKTDLLEEIAIVQRSGSLTQTAYALLSDLIGIARDVTAPPARRPVSGVIP